MRMLNVSYKRGSSLASAFSSVTNKDQAGLHDPCSQLDIEDTFHGVLTVTLDTLLIHRPAPALATRSANLVPNYQTSINM